MTRYEYKDSTRTRRLMGNAIVCFFILFATVSTAQVRTVDLELHPAKVTVSSQTYSLLLSIQPAPEPLTSKANS